MFEISAIKAFCATNLLRKLQDNPNVALPQMEIAPDIAEKILGTDWEEELQNISAEKLKSEAEELWDE